MKVVLAAEEPGSKAFLEPMLARLEEEGWRVAQTPDPEGADVVVTGTSLGARVELDLIRSAREAQVPSVAVVDSWTNYRARFERNGQQTLPDLIGVVDDFMAKEMHALGFPREKLRIVGHPGLDAVAARMKHSTEADRRRVREELQVPDGIPLIVFFSQPIAQMFGRARGYDEQDALRLVRTLIDRSGQPVELRVKFHPSQAAPARTRDGVRVAQKSFEDLILAADVAAGMTSIALVHAAMAGRPVLSVQPGLCVEDALVLDRMGLLDPVTEEPPTGREATELLKGRTLQGRVPVTWGDGRGVERTIQLIHEVINGVAT